MKQRTFLITAVVTCSVAGFVVGRISKEPTVAEAQGFAQDGRPIASTRVRDGFERGADGSRGPRDLGLVRTGKREPRPLASHGLSPVDGVNSIIHNPNSIERAKAWLEFIDHLNPSDFKEVAVICRDLRKRNPRSNEYDLLLAAWADHDPYAALDHLNEHAGYSTDHMTVMAAWAAKDPLSAMRWAEQRPQNLQGNLMVAEVIKGVAASDPHRAAQMLDDLPQQVDRQRALISVMESMAVSDPKVAISYMEKINDPKMRSQALEGIANKLSTIDPRATLNLIDANPELVRDDIVRELIWGARSKEPALGADAINRIENQKIREGTYRIYIQQWLRRDYDAAVDWVNRNELPVEVRRSVDVMIDSIAGHN